MAYIMMFAVGAADVYGGVPDYGEIYETHIYGTTPAALVIYEETAEIIVTFRTPSYVELRLTGDGVARGGGSYRERALAAHAAFFQQLGDLEMRRGRMGSPIEIVSEHYRLLNGVAMRVPVSMVDLIADLPEVIAVSPNYRFYLAPQRDLAHAAVPFSGITHNNAARQMMGINTLHNTYGITGNGVRVAVLDTGVDSNHPSLQRYRCPTLGRIRGWCTFNPANANTDWHTTNHHSHGTHVTGTVVAMAPDVELWHFRVANSSGAGNVNNIISGLEAAHSQNVDVVNVSLGVGLPVANINQFAWNLIHAYNLAVSDGMVVVVAAGNDGPAFTSIGDDKVALLPIVVAEGQRGGEHPNLPPNVADLVVPFSSRGPTPQFFQMAVDIVAPGTGIRSTERGGGYGYQSGTSMAAPHIAGIAALMLQAFPDASPYEVKARIMNTARELLEERSVSIVWNSVPFANLHGVFASGAGHVRPLESMTSHSQSFVTAVHDAPQRNPALPGNWQFMMRPAVLSSVSFGLLGGSSPMGVFIPGILPENSRSVTLTVHNTSGAARSYIPIVQWRRNHGNAANLTLSRPRIDVAPGGTEQFNVTLSFGGNVQGAATGINGFYEGQILFTLDGSPATERMRVPFAAVNTSTVNVAASLVSFVFYLEPVVSINVNHGTGLYEFVADNRGGFMDEPVRVGYEFRGWYLDEDLLNPLTVDFVMPVGALTLFAGWDEAAVPPQVPLPPPEVIPPPLLPAPPLPPPPVVVPSPAPPLLPPLPPPSQEQEPESSNGDADAPAPAPAPTPTPPRRPPAPAPEPEPTPEPEVEIQIAPPLPPPTPSPPPEAPPHTTAPPAPLPFTDVEPAAWYYSAVRTVWERRLFAGVSEDTFDAEENMTRAMLVQVLANLDGVNLDLYNFLTAGRFYDVASDAWYFGAVEWAAGLGLVSGVGGGNFAPGNLITRQETVVMINSFAVIRGIALPQYEMPPFADQDEIAPWAADSVRALQAGGIISGRPGGMFAPRDAITRAEAAVIFARFLEFYSAIYQDPADTAD